MMFPLIVNKGAVTANGESVGILEISNTIDAKKLNFIVWAFIAGSILYSVIRLLTRRNSSFY